MKKHLFIIISLIMALVLSIGVCAAAVDWELEDEDFVLTDGTEKYEYYQLPSNIYFDAESLYVYNTGVYFEYGGGADVTRSENCEEIFFVVDYSYDSLKGVYASDHGISLLEDFKNGSFTKIRLRKTSNYDMITIENSYLDELASPTGEKITIDVTELDKLRSYDLIGYDYTDCLATVFGTIYNMKDGLYFLDYESLSNSNFDSEGNLSYMSGTVEIIKLEDEGYFASACKEVGKNGDRRITSYTYEPTDTTEIDRISTSVAKTELLMVTAVFGYAVPCVPFVFGLVLPHTKKHGYTKRWYTLCVLSLSWMLLATAILLIVLL